MTKVIAAIDQGTSSTRCILFDQNGKIISAAQKDHKQIYPFPGWVEHGPIEIIQRVKEVVSTSISDAGLLFNDISAIGITNQRETTVVWNRHTGLPYGNAIVWQDTRTADICNQLAEIGGQDRYRSTTGLPLATYFSGSKIKWLLDNVPGLRVAAEKGDAMFGTMDTWIIWNLTGGIEGGAHVTDVTNASRTLLMDIYSLQWDSGILSDLDIPRSMLPEIQPSSGNFGQAKDFGGIPILGDLGDQQAALFGQTCFSPGEAKNTYGTGCFLLLNTGEQAVPSSAGLITTLSYQIEGQPPCYCLEGSIAITGALVQWLRDNLKIINNSSDVETLAASVGDNGGIYFVPAFSGLFAPYWRNDARGIIIGMTRYTNQGHIARAALEATAYQTREVVEAMQLDSGVNLLALKVDGGMVENNLLMQFQADILGVEIIRPRIAETTALGAAYAAGLSAGVWHSLAELREQWDGFRIWRPRMNQIDRDKLYNGWKKAVTHSFDWESQDAN